MQAVRRSFLLPLLQALVEGKLLNYTTSTKKALVRDLSSSESFNNYLDIDEEMEDLNSMEDFNKMMDTLALQPKEA
jgi:hypothetical protein